MLISYLYQYQIKYRGILRLGLLFFEGFRSRFWSSSDRERAAGEDMSLGMMLDHCALLFSSSRHTNAVIADECF